MSDIYSCVDVEMMCDALNIGEEYAPVECLLLKKGDTYSGNQYVVRFWKGDTQETVVLENTSPDEVFTKLETRLSP